MSRQFLSAFALTATLAACDSTPSPYQAQVFGAGDVTYRALDIRSETRAPLQIDVAARLPLPPEETMRIMVDFDNYETWVLPAPEAITVDNSRRGSNSFGAGSLVNWSKEESDLFVAYDPAAYMMSKPLWKTDILRDHRGLVLVKPDGNGGSIVHFRRYFEPVGFQGWMMATMMPVMMSMSADNLVEIHGGERLETE